MMNTGMAAPSTGVPSPAMRNDGTNIKERPILFSAPMVRALLARTKTQTRRVAKHPLAIAAKRILSYHGETEFDCILPDDSGGIILCPYGNPGDRLWVREGWRASSAHNPLPPSLIPAGDAIEYTADAERVLTGKCRPSIHMPRFASRILLEIVSVRVERLQEISEADALAEGINCYPFRPDDGFPICSGYTHQKDDGKCVLHPSAVVAYRHLWESINGPDSWAANPWVWVVEFRRLP